MPGVCKDVYGMHYDRVYGFVLEETPDYVVVLDVGKQLRLERCRMYNSQIDLKGYLYTDYAEKEYQHRDASLTKTADASVTKTKRSEGAKAGWETRRNK